MKTKRIIISAAAGILAFGVGFAGVAVAAAAVETLSSLFSKNDIAERKAPVIEQTTAPPAAIVTETISNEVESTNETESEDDTVEFYAGGMFYIDGEKLPIEFRDIVSLDIVTHDFDKMNDDGTAGVPIPPKGELRTKKQFRFSRIGINGKTIAFQTETVNGVSYRFTGSYRSRDSCETDGPTPDLTGKLIKIKDGKWAASMKVGFYAEGCGC